MVSSIVYMADDTPVCIFHTGSLSPRISPIIDAHGISAVTRLLSLGNTGKLGALVRYLRVSLDPSSPTLSQPRPRGLLVTYI